MRSSILLLGALFVLSVSAAESQAQTLFGSGGTTGGTTSGSRATTGGATAGGLGGAPTGGAATSAANVGQGLGTTNLNAADGSLSATVGQGGFVGGQNNGTFTGNRFAGQGATQTTQPQFGNLQNNNNTNRNQNRQNQGRSDRKPVRPVYRLEFASPVVSMEQIQSRLDLNAINLPANLTSSPTINIKVGPDGEVTLSGTVGSDREKKQLESYVRMEPGVRGIQNELAVSSTN